MKIDMQLVRWHLLWKWRGITDDGIKYRADIPQGATLSIPCGYAACKICGDSLSWKMKHYIGFTHAFPYCQECHESASARRKIGAMWRLFKEWYEMCPGDLWAYRGPGGYARIFLFSVLGILIGE